MQRYTLVYAGDWRGDDGAAAALRLHRPGPGLQQGPGQYILPIKWLITLLHLKEGGGADSLKFQITDEKNTVGKNNKFMCHHLCVLLELYCPAVSLGLYGKKSVNYSGRKKNIFLLNIYPWLGVCGGPLQGSRPIQTRGPKARVRGGAHRTGRSK